MVMNTQFFNDYSSDSSLNLSSKNSQKTNRINTLSSKTAADLLDKSKSYSNVSEKKDFNEVLKLKKQSSVSEKEDKKYTSDSNISSKVNESNKKTEDIKEDSQEKSGEKEISHILEELINSLNNLILNNDFSIEVNASNESNMLTEIIEKISTNNTDENSMLKQLISEGNGINDIKQLLNKLNIVSDNENTKKEISNIISKLEEINRNSSDEGQEKLINSEISAKQRIPNHNSTMENSNNSEMKDKKDSSKEDKFLSSLIDSNDTVDNKINLFAARTQNVQAQNGEVRGLTVNKATFASDLIRNVKFMNTNGIKELTVKVNPGNLGEITIKLVQEDGIMKANLKADSKETTALLSQNLAEIKKELGDQNIKIAEVNIDLYNEDTTFFKNENFGGHLFQEQGKEKKSSQSNSNLSIENIDDDESLKDNIAMFDNSLDFLV